MTLYGEVAIKSRYLEAKHLKFSPPKSLCGTVGSPWVSLATLFGFWETLIKFSESMILYGEIRNLYSVSISRGMKTDIAINAIRVMFSVRLIVGVVPAMRNVGRARSLILMPTPQTMHSARLCP